MPNSTRLTHNLDEAVMARSVARTLIIHLMVLSRPAQQYICHRVAVVVRTGLRLSSSQVGSLAAASEHQQTLHAMVSAKCNICAQPGNVERVTNNCHLRSH